VATPTVTTLDSGVILVFDVSKDGTRAAYAKNVNPASTNGVINLFDLYVSSVSGSKCTLSTAVKVPSLSAFLDSGAGMVWADVDPTTFVTHGWYADLATCAPMQFATDIFLGWIPIGNEGFVYGDEWSSDGTEITLRASKVAGTSLPMGPSIQTRATPVFAPLLPALPAVVYTVNVNDSTQDGVYMNAMLPFTPSAN
jgi:hypothetical protein